jgi:uncharacterized protein YbbC (DUF1343 family)
MSVTLGLTRLLASRRLDGLSVGLVCNPASVDGHLRHAADQVAADDRVTLGAIFGPQHGFTSTLQDNMIETPHARDALRRVPVHSLYSETREPTAAMLDGIDVLVVDLQDVGARIYTFIYTMANCLRAGRRHGVPVIVCDRPNPIGGAEVEGATITPGFESFVGQFPIPMRHGMTIGELAQLFNGHFDLGADLEVVWMDGWRRSAYWDQIGLAWVMPSPNMPTLDTAIVYPGTVLFEGTQLSEGRGTTRPFEYVGAPWIDAERFAADMNDLGLDGVAFRPVYFEPTFQKHAGKTCGGCQVHVLDRQRFKPVLTGAALLARFHAADSIRFAWRQPPYEYEAEKMPIDILAGSPRLREQIETGASPREIAASWVEDVRAFMPVRQRYLIYTD